MNKPNIYLKYVEETLVAANWSHEIIIMQENF